MQKSPLIVDNGTGYIKIGYSDQQFPQDHIASIVGRRVLRAESLTETPLSKEVYFGNEALKHRNQLELTHVLSEGIIRDWDAMEKLWEYCFE